MRQRLLYVALCTALHGAACSDVVASPDRVATHGRDGYAGEHVSPDDAYPMSTTQRPLFLITPCGEIRVRDTVVVHACPSKGEATPVHRPVGFDGRRIRPMD